MKKKELLKEIDKIITRLTVSIEVQKAEKFLTMNYSTSKEILSEALVLKSKLEKENDELSEIAEMYYTDLINYINKPII